MRNTAEQINSADRIRASWGIGLIALALCTALALCAPAAGGAMNQKRTGVAAGAPRMPATMIACFEKGSKNFLNKTQPANCEVAGYEGEHGHRWVRIPIKGIAWNEWGVGNTPGTGGEDLRTGGEVEMFAYRRIRCGDGRIFYSHVSVINLRSGHSVHLRLPICDDPTPKS